MLLTSERQEEERIKKKVNLWFLAPDHLSKKYVDQK